MKLLHNPRAYLLIISFLLFIIPFFWLKPGEMDLGGDSSRLYFYDPLNYLKYSVLYATQHVGMGVENPLYLFLPFNIVLIILMKVFNSGYLIITLFNSLSLVVAFLSMYGIAKELMFGKILKKNYSFFGELASLFVGVYYVFSPVMTYGAWDKAIFTHYQLFLNPLIFFLLLKFFVTKKMIYLLFTLLITFIFSVNFSWGASPAIFAFYPLALLYLFLYAIRIRKLTINIKNLIIFSSLFIWIHLFHILPLVFSLLDKSGLVYQKVLQGGYSANPALDYFLGIAPSVKLTRNILGLPQQLQSISSVEFLFFAIPFIIILGLIFSTYTFIDREQKKNFLLLLSIFLVALFFATANITTLGLEVYKNLFAVPGFSMFRNYYGQWQFAYLFFLSLVIGYGFFYVLIKIHKKLLCLMLFFALTFFLAITAFPFIRGDRINLILNIGQKIEFKVPIRMDPAYEQVLDYIRKDPIDGKYITFPLSESFSQMIAGIQGGMYQGPSTIVHLTPKSDFNGYQVLSPFSEVFLSLVKEKDYDSLSRLLGILNIKHIFHNSDPLIMNYFPDFPYQHVKNFLPLTQVGYSNFINSLPVIKEKNFGERYHIYNLNGNYYLPHVYVPKESKIYKNNLNPWGYVKDPFFKAPGNKDPRIVYLEDNKIKIEGSIPKINFVKINPSKYYVKITSAKKPYILVFSESFNNNWKLFLSNKEIKSKTVASYFNGEIEEMTHINKWIDLSGFETLGKNPIADKNHFMANAYANGWYIEPENLGNKTEYTLVLEMTSQRVGYISLFTSLLAITVLIGWIIKNIRKDLSLKSY